MAEWYAVHIFPLFVHTVGRILSVLPFSVAEILLFALPAALIIKPRLLRKLPLIALGLLLIFMLTCGINYHRNSFAAWAGIEVRPATAQDLQQVYHILIEQTPPKFSPLPKVLHTKARSSMLGLSQIYPGLAGYYPNPKPLLLSKGMSMLNLTGIYSPFTMEANYNKDIPPVLQPFTICHELAHLGGYSREDEANFIAYLACQKSGDNSFVYSGNLQAIIYVLNALYTVCSPQEYRQLYQELPPQIQQDLAQISAYWQQYQGRAGKVSETVNNAYLKANLQQDGVQSYGRMVDLLIAYYLSSPDAL